MVQKSQQSSSPEIKSLFSFAKENPNQIVTSSEGAAFYTSSPDADATERPKDVLRNGGKDIVLQGFSSQGTILYTLTK